MLADSKINSLDTRLEQFKLNDQTRHVDLTNLLKEYGQLLDEYKTLKNAYENSSSRGTTSPGAVPTSTESAAAEPRNPYVLVLVDGNGYIFNDELISDKEEGGMRAARMLSEAVEKYLAHSVPHARQARVFVRIYADLTNLSKQLAKSKVVGLEKRSISSFTAGFTRAISLFDYVDALDEEGTKFKITEQFKVASEDAACSHIVFAGCHDSAYLSQLIPYSGVRDKITLVQGAGWNSEFQQFNLNITQFPTLFRWSGLPAVAPPSKAAAPAASKHKAAAPKLVLMPGASTRKESWRRDGSFSVTDSTLGDSSPPLTNNGFREQDRVGWEERSAYTQTAKGGQKSASKEKQPCTFFQKGVCRYGNKCNFQHIPKGFDSSNGVNGNHPPSGQSSQFFSVQSSQAPPASSQAFQNPNKRSNISSVLPTTVVHGFIPINRSHKRLDPYIPTPTQQDWKKYNTLFQEAKPCNTYHLQGICTAFPCPYDHSPIDPDTKRVLEYVVKGNPCPQKGECRKDECFYGHVCQKDGCMGLQGQVVKGCKFKPELHYGVEECRLASLVPGTYDANSGGVGVDGLDPLGGHPAW
ncbi:zf-CCCH domain containing protein [Pyrenophora tritici-repentis]|uniref:Herpes-BLLF1 multi-domain protein n=1 Tax=Pyrenophora tritici-repentis TaxID=45151 RepID=A0A2W1HBP0_9PLEO|nr:ZnF-C3H1 domain-containing protein [Pyrenophora tritici-repentis]KAF7454653.1 ZnF C3H1 domain containing protein [Pyrenophora tritici-repentis]KAF7577779.1 Herpes-BLLF1 multi-domain protein [Pyrenophora tritici-repentis]KAG9388410.1 ZnF C3H1 domain containing protein [Pyrenophora tritici-repentis]KAI0578654.1 ZnF-C3H1 domain-containing protein [Pyrenophora tritici-repentis]